MGRDGDDIPISSGDAGRTEGATIRFARRDPLPLVQVMRNEKQLPVPRLGYVAAIILKGGRGTRGGTGRHFRDGSAAAATRRLISTDGGKAGLARDPLQARPLGAVRRCRGCCHSRARSSCRFYTSRAPARAVAQARWSRGTEWGDSRSCSADARHCYTPPPSWWHLQRTAAPTATWAPGAPPMGQQPQTGAAPTAPVGNCRVCGNGFEPRAPPMGDTQVLPAPRNTSRLPPRLRERGRQHESGRHRGAREGAPGQTSTMGGNPYCRSIEFSTRGGRHRGPAAISGSPGQFLNRARGRRPPLPLHGVFGSTRADAIGGARGRHQLDRGHRGTASISN